MCVRLRIHLYFSIMLNIYVKFQDSKKVVSGNISHLYSILFSNCKAFRFSLFIYTFSRLLLIFSFFLSFCSYWNKTKKRIQAWCFCRWQRRRIITKTLVWINISSLMISSLHFLVWKLESEEGRERERTESGNRGII